MTASDSRITDEQLEQARGVDLLSFLQQYQPGELKRVGQTWTLRSHDSMRISADGRWNWFHRASAAATRSAILKKCMA